VKAKGHLFCRWDDGKERFNIEATSPGFNPRPDSFYRRWPELISDEEVERGDYLRNLTPREELVQCIAQRGNCLTDHLDFPAAADAYRYAQQIAPNDHANENHLAMITLMNQMWQEASRGEDPFNSWIPMPRPNDVWERIYLPDAWRSLNRILANHRTSPGREPNHSAQAV
jgi:hypothetical protein